MAGVRPSALGSPWSVQSFLAAGDERKFPSPACGGGSGPAGPRERRFSAKRAFEAFGWGLLRLPGREATGVDLGGARVFLARWVGGRRLPHGRAGAELRLSRRPARRGRWLLRGGRRAGAVRPAADRRPGPA